MIRAGRFKLYHTIARHCCTATQPLSVVVNLQFTTNGMCVKNNTHVARTIRNKMSTTSVATAEVFLLYLEFWGLH